MRDSLVERFDADLDRPVRQLSTGNRQKLGLIQAFMHEPELLILDEPIAGLDPLVQQSFHALLGEVSAQGRTVFLSSHTLSEVERVTHRLAILRQGRLVVVDSVENLRKVAIQRLEIEFAAPVDADEFRALPGVTEVQADGRTVDGRIRGVRRRRGQDRGRATRCARSVPAKTTWRTSSCATTGRSRDVSWPTIEYHAAPATAGRAVGGVGLIAVMAAVGALFPAVGHTIGKLRMSPQGVANLLGGADYGTITGWFRSEIGSIYGPLVIGALAITGASATTAGEEEDRILGAGARPPGPTLAADRRQGGCDRRVVVIVAFATWVGLIVGVARRRRRDHDRPHGRVRRPARVLRVRHRRGGDRARRRHRPPSARHRRRRGRGNPRLADQQLRPAGQRHQLAQIPVAVLLLRRP